MNEMNEVNLNILAWDNVITDNCGVKWIAIKPICEALKVDYRAQLKVIMNSDTLLSYLSNQIIDSKDGRPENMVCLQEYAIYGWIFQLRSNSKILEEFNQECYKCFAAHFNVF